MLLLLLVLLLLVLLLLILLLLRILLLLLRRRRLSVLLGASMSAAGSTHLLVVGLVLCQNFLSHLLLALMDIRIELIAILLDGELLVVVNWDKDFLRTYWFLLWVVELLHIRMLQCLFCG